MPKRRDIELLYKILPKSTDRTKCTYFAENLLTRIDGVVVKDYLKMSKLQIDSSALVISLIEKDR